MDYKVSVITPVYNSEKTLLRSFESLKAQTIGFENIEWIAVDDRSKDGSLAIIEKIAAEHENVTVVRRESNSGFAGAPRNDGVRIARAPYIMLFDADDLLTENALELMYNAAEESGADIVTGYFSFEREDGSVITPITENYDRAAEGLHDFSDGLGDFVIMSETVWNKLLRASVIKENNLFFPEDRWGEDTCYTLEYLFCCASGYYVKKSVYRYIVYDGSVSHEKSCKYLRSMGIMLKDMFELFSRHGKEDYLYTFLEYYKTVEYYLSELIISDKELPDGELREIFENFRFAAGYMEQKGLSCVFEPSRIMVRDIAEGDMKKALFTFHSLREYEKQKQREIALLREQFEGKQAELDNVLSSRIWRWGSRIAALLGRE